ncbi:glycosyl transferase family 90-domain-containing protein [Roridomyces roridus]|uniref:Glycosyl transferase family 90-domain-containing protein n=1 Tax=Roridomyces roridus TaxID=1738132 RepID=A0AAD7C6Y1_9AGAR|nr:glycosyl transferase family 90-domain-containing protein [Roridomyces roridus]
MNLTGLRLTTTIPIPSDNSNLPREGSRDSDSVLKKQLYKLLGAKPSWLSRRHLLAVLITLCLVVGILFTPIFISLPGSIGFVGDAEPLPDILATAAAPNVTVEQKTEADLAVDALYARQSTTLVQAAARYSLRTGRDPPPNYDRWFQFARDRKCLVDEYDQIHRDFKPFYQLAERNKEYFGRIVNRAARQLMDTPAEICRVEIRNGEPFFAGYTAYGGTWPDSFSKFSEFLPNTTFLINGLDEPRVAFNVRAPHALERAFLLNDSIPFHIDPNSTADFFARQSGCNNIPLEEDGFMQSANEVHSFLMSSAKSGFTTDLYPMLSMARISPCFSDILYPSEYFYSRSWWSAKYSHEDDIPWSNKTAKLYWRGMSTGGMIRGNNYHTFMRFKLVSLGRAHPDLLDVKFTRFAETLCLEEEGCDRAAVAEAYNITEAPEPREDGYAFRYAMDVDGTTFSGRFLALLRSGSLVFKATLFEEFFNDWLRPFEHYIPVKADLSDLVQQLKWANEHPDEARLIQQRGQAMARRVMTDDQNDCYFVALLLEWSRLQEESGVPFSLDQD